MWQHWCGSVDWVPACKSKGCWFDSQSGHMPGLQARSPVGGAQEATTDWCISPFPPSLPFSLKITKWKVWHMVGTQNIWCKQWIYPSLIKESVGKCHRDWQSPWNVSNCSSQSGNKFGFFRWWIHSFVHSFVHKFNKHWLSTTCAPGVVSSAVDSEIKEW